MPLCYGKDFFDTYEGPFDNMSEHDFQVVWRCLPASVETGIVLDLACGSGAVGKRVKAIQPSVSVIGVDITPNLLKWVDFPKCQSDALYLPFQDNSFDCIIAAAAFHHFPDIDMAIRECFRCLKTPGVLLAYDPNKLHPQRFIMMTDPLRYIFYKNGDHAISPIRFRKMLVKNGFKEARFRFVAFKGSEAGTLAKLNHSFYSIFRNVKFDVMMPVIAPWFVITAIKN